VRLLFHLRHAARERRRSAVLSGKRDLDKAKQLVKESGYKGEKIVVLDATDQPIVHPQALITTSSCASSA